MGSSFWVWTSGRPLTAAGSFWNRATSRIQVNWTTRMFRQDEEMLVLTQSDELNRMYGENSSSRDLTSLNALRETGNQQRSEHWSAEATGVYTGTTADTAVSSPTNGNRPKSCRKSYRLTGPTGNRLKQQGLNEEEEIHRHNSKLKNKKVNICLVALDEGLHATTPSLEAPPPTITSWEAGWNVTNAIQGIFVLALPAALLQAGYAGLVLLVASAWLCNHTGKTLVACLYDEEQSGGSVSRVRVRHSYRDIMEACCGKLCPNWARVGGMLVTVAQVIELVMTCSGYLLVSTGLLADSLPGVARSWCLLGSVSVLLPCLLLSRLGAVSILSLLGSVAHSLISVLLLMFCLSRSSSWSFSALSLSVNPEDFLVSGGVILFSYTSQIFLPPLEGSMEDRGGFNAMLGWTHGAACLMKTTLSLTAVLTWGSQTKEVITDNLPSDLRPVVNVCLLAKALLSFPLPFYSAAAILQSSASRGEGGGALARRAAVLLWAWLLALLVPSSSLLMGLTGSVAGAALALILPSAFHLTLRWRRLSAGERLLDAAILGLGLVCGVSGVACSVKRLIGRL